MSDIQWDLGPLVGTSRRIITPGDEPFIARVVAHVFEHKDALLIVAAPDLLSALKVSAEHVCSLLCPSVRKANEEWAHSKECQQIQAAILKAQGA